VKPTTTECREALSPSDVSQLVPMPRLLEALGVAVNQYTRRAPCILHGGSNPTALSWREDGRWHCFSCGRGGDRIALVRAVHQASFRKALGFLARLAGLEHNPGRMSRQDIAAARRRREQAEAAAWRVSDELLRVRGYYADALHRADHLCWRIGAGLKNARTDAAHEAGWNALARLAPAQTYFLAHWKFLGCAEAPLLARFALADARSRREAGLGVLR
jgi:CHC2 zinc finger